MKPWVRIVVFVAILVALVLGVKAFGQTMVTKTIQADPVTTWDDGTPIPAGTVVTYDLEHRYCGGTSWTVVAPGLAAPSAVRPLGLVCHEYAYVAIANGQRSVESVVLTVDLTPAKVPHAPLNVRAQ